MTTAQKIQLQILRFLALNGPTPKHELKLPFLGVGDSSYSRRYRSLITNNFILEEGPADQRVVRLTRKGIDFVRQNCPTIKFASIPARTDKEKFSRQINMAAARAVMAGAGIFTFDGKKPSLGDLASEDEEVREAATAQLLKTLARGVFYSAAEIKRWFSDNDGSDDTYYKSRLAGVLFVPHRAYFVFSIGNSLIRISTKHEQKLCSSIVEKISAIPALRVCFLGYRYDGDWPCLIIADRKGMLPKIWYGDASGQRDTTLTKKGAARIRRWQSMHFTMAALSDLFGDMYFTTTSRDGVNVLKVLVSGPEENIRAMSDAYELEQYGDQTERIFYDDKDSKLACYLLPDMNFAALYQTVKGMKASPTTYARLILLAPKYYVDPISRCLGYQLAQYHDAETGEEVRYERYTNDGKPCADSYMQGLQGFHGEN